jgi:hypothetical protein
VAYADVIEVGDQAEDREEYSGAEEMLVAGGGQAVRGRVQRRWAAREIELARRVHVGSGHGHFTTLQEICRNGCWDHIPEGVDWAGLFADVGRKIPCVWCRLAKDRRMDTPVGTGVHSGEIGADFSFDVIGPFQVLTIYRARYFILFVDLATGWEYALLIDARDAATLKACAKQLQIVNSAFGHSMRSLRCDAGAPEKSAEMEEAMADFDSGVRMLPAASGNQRANPVERRVQNIKREIALSLSGQSVLGAQYWGLVVLEVIRGRRTRPNSLSREFGASVTPQELNEGRRPSFREAVSGLSFGTLGTSPIAEKKPSLGTLSNELRVYVGRDETDSNAVLTVEAPPTRNMLPRVTRDFKPLFLRGTTVSPQVMSRKCELVETDGGTIEVRMEGDGAIDMGLTQLGLCESQDATVHTQADEMIQAIKPGAWSLLNGGDPARVARDVGSMARSTRSAVRRADSESREGVAMVAMGIEESEERMVCQLEEVDEESMLMEMVPEDWGEEEYVGFVSSGLELLDAFHRGELHEALEDTVGDLGEFERLVYKAQKAYTADAPRYQDMMRSSEERRKWLPEVRAHMRQLIHDFALEKMPAYKRRKGLRVVKWMIDLRTKLNPDGTFDKLKARWNLRGDLIRRGDKARGVEVQTYAPTLRMSSFRRMVAMRAYYGSSWTLKSLDVTSAFSSTDSTREEPLYVELPHDILDDSEGDEDDESRMEPGELELYRVNASGQGLAEASHDFAYQAIMHARQAGLVQTSGDKAMLHWRPAKPRPGVVVGMGRH